jgi:hypothetical protein
MVSEKKWQGRKLNCDKKTSYVVFMSEFLRVCLVLKIILVLYGFLICLHIYETPFTCGIYTELRELSSLFGRLLPLELMTKSMKSLR